MENNKPDELGQRLSSAELVELTKKLVVINHELSNALLTLKVSYELLEHTVTPNDDQKKKMGFINAAISQASAASDGLGKVCKRLVTGDN